MPTARRPSARSTCRKLASGEWVGCFGLTEPDAGSDPGGMTTRAEKVADGYRLTGTKMWISNAPIADVFVVWAKSAAHEGKIRGFVLEKGMRASRRPRSAASSRLRCSITGEIVMDGVVVPEENLLPNVSGLKPAPSVVSTARATASPGAPWVRPRTAGTAPRHYTLDRKQFGRPLCRHPAGAEEARRHADRDFALACRARCAWAG